MKIKSTLFNLIILLIIPFGIQAQKGSGRDMDDSKLESYRIAFFTQKLGLSTEESKAFWPVYDKYQGELKSLRMAQREQRKNMRADFEGMSDKDIEKFIDSEIQFRQNDLDLMKKYNSQFKSVLPIRKVALLYKTEEDFKRELLKRLQDRQGPPGKK